MSSGVGEILPFTQSFAYTYTAVSESSQKGCLIKMNDMNITIDTLYPGEYAVVDHVVPSPLSERLAELGVVAGTLVKCLHRAPLGDPSAFGIRGAVIALRKEDSRSVVAASVGGYDG